MTYSIAARCARTGEFGAAIATAMPAVGALCVWTRSGIGVVCTQAWTNPNLGIDALDAMQEGLAAEDAASQALSADQGSDQRQLGVVSANGPAFCWTGATCTGWCGHLAGADFAAQGNMLTGPQVVEALARAFQASEGQSLDERLLHALETAQAVGGDKRGRQSAALAVIGQERYRRIDLRVDEHADPVAELRRIHGIARAQLGPRETSRPGRDGISDPMPDSVRSMALKSPPDRPLGGGSRTP